MTDIKLLPATSTRTALELRMANRLLRLNPGLGDKAQELAESLADSGLSPAATSMLLQAVYSPTDSLGRGQTVRSGWFIKAVQRRYSYKIEKIRNDPTQFRNFLAEMEEVVEMRDTLNGEGIIISFESAFLLWELGLNADAVMGIIQEECNDMTHYGVITKHIINAAQMVQAGFFMELETAIKEMRHGYEYERTND